MSEMHAASSGSKKRDKKNNKKASEKAVTVTKSSGESKSLFKLQKSKRGKLKEENNNINKQTKLNVNENVCKSSEITNDEVIKDRHMTVYADSNSNTIIDCANVNTEEFDFDDTDLKELNACENSVAVNAEMEIIEDLKTNNNNNESADTTKRIDNNDNVDKQQHRQNDHKQLENRSQETRDIDEDDCNTTSEGHNLTPAVSTSVELIKRKVASPAALELKTNSIMTEGSEEKYCPITPRRIVDVEEFDEYDVPNRVLRSSSSKAIISTKNNDNKDTSSVNDPTTTTTCKTSMNNNVDKDDDDNEGEDGDYYDDDDEPDNELLVQFLGEANRIAEARLAARRQARAEAREIRMRELERQQKEQEQNADRVFDMHASSGIDPLARSRLTVGINSSSPVGGLLNSARGSSMSSRRSSEDSLEEEGRSLRDIRHELRDVEERFRKAMIANAQLDNERSSQSYQIQLLKDKLEEMEESYAQLQREFKEKSRDCNALKRNLDKLNEELKLVQGQLNERDTLIAEQGLVIVIVENEDGSDAKRALVSCENAHLLGSVQGSLDVRLKKFSEEKQQLVTEIQQLQEQLDQCKSQGKGRGNSMNGPTSGDEEYEAQREANKIISDFKYKLQKAEQEIANLQASLARSETQVIRYKSTAEAAEKAEAELKIERRKLQRENREAMERLEELETSNNHLLKRLDKLKNAKSALLKDL